MQLVPLTPDYSLVAFDCGDDDLNRFLLDDAKHAQVIGLAASLVEELRIANTFILEDEGRIAAYFCLLNDRISRSEITGSRWKKIRAKFPVSKQFFDKRSGKPITAVIRASKSGVLPCPLTIAGRTSALG